MRWGWGGGILYYYWMDLDTARGPPWFHRDQGAMVDHVTNIIFLVRWVAIRYICCCCFHRTEGSNLWMMSFGAASLKKHVAQ